MRELAKGVFLQEGDPGVGLGAVGADGSALLIDCPLRLEDGREWLAEVGARGRPRYLVCLDDHPDRVYGARGLDLALIAQSQAREAIAAWPDPLRVNAQLLGAGADRLNGVSGLARAGAHPWF